MHQALQTGSRAQAAVGSEVGKNDPTLIPYFAVNAWQNTSPALGSGRDGLGSPHHEAGTLWMGADLATSVKNASIPRSVGGRHASEW
jgi:hypothetical protein